MTRAIRNAMVVAAASASTSFGAPTGTPAAAASPAAVVPAVPAETAFDHLIVAVSDLDKGIAWMEERSGARAMVGGSHPGRGTRNALLSLGAGHYLEIIAPDPAQAESKQGEPAEMAKLESPLLGGWAVTSKHLARDLERVRAAGLEIAGPFPGGRERPDGRKLAWQTAFSSGTLAESLPFLIEWGAGSAHPSSDAPALGTVESLRLVHPDPDAVRAALAKLGVSMTVEKGAKAELHARIRTARGVVDL